MGARGAWGGAGGGGGTKKNEDKDQFPPRIPRARDDDSSNSNNVSHNNSNKGGSGPGARVRSWTDSEITRNYIRPPPNRTSVEAHDHGAIGHKKQSRDTHSNST